MLFGLVFALLAFVLILFLWSGSMLLQGWWYQSPADRMPIRAAVSGSVMALFLTLWCLLDARSGGKYDTLFEFSPMEITEHDAFDCVMKNSAGQEMPPIHYQKRAGAKGSTADFVDGKSQPWKKNTSDSMAVAILLPEKDKPEPTRFNANLDAKGNFPQGAGELRYVDAAGRYMTTDSLGRVYRKKTGVLFANIFLNVLHFVLWWMVLWYGVRYSLWHAFSLAFVMWLFVMVAVQPVLFNQTRPTETRTAKAGPRIDASAWRLFRELNPAVNLGKRDANRHG